MDQIVVLAVKLNPYIRCNMYAAVLIDSSDT